MKKSFITNARKMDGVVLTRFPNTEMKYTDFKVKLCILRDRKGVECYELLKPSQIITGMSGSSEQFAVCVCGMLTVFRSRKSPLWSIICLRETCGRVRASMGIWSK